MTPFRDVRLDFILSLRGQNLRKNAANDTYAMIEKVAECTGLHFG
ncbi:hypothetical protein [Novipirellula rosea]